MRPPLGGDRVHRPHGVLDGDLLAGLGAGAKLVGQHLEPHEALDARHELHVVDGLGQEIVGAGLEALHAVATAGRAR